MTMNNNSTLVPIEDLANRNQSDMSGTYDIKGATVYAGRERIGKVRTALAEQQTGRIRYLVVDVGGWFNDKEIMVPVGMARIEDDAVYFDNLTRDQVSQMNEYRHGEMMSNAAMASDESVLRGSTVNARSDRYDFRDNDMNDTMFKSPQRLQLLEERLFVDKHRENVGQVQVGKHVETRQQSVGVDLAHDEVIIERHPVTDGRPVEGAARLGADSETIRVDVEAERADVRKQAYVAEEIEVSKKQEVRHENFNEQVGREVLDVERTGNLRENPDDDDARRR